MKMVPLLSGLNCNFVLFLGEHCLVAPKSCFGAALRAGCVCGEAAAAQRSDIAIAATGRAAKRESAGGRGA